MADPPAAKGASRPARTYLRYYISTMVTGQYPIAGTSATCSVLQVLTESTDRSRGYEAKAVPAGFSCQCAALAHHDQ